jgi:hypothetical protein
MRKFRKYKILYMYSFKYNMGLFVSYYKFERQCWQRDFLLADNYDVRHATFAFHTEKY